MGLLKHLLFWPVTGPNFLARFSMEKVQDAVREQLTDDQAVKEDLLALQMELELGEVDDEEYVVREAELMMRLRDVRHWREQFGMGTSGGPVQVAGRGGGDVKAGSPPEPPGGDATDEAAHGSSEDTGDEDRRGGIARPEGADVELNFDWE